MSDESSMDDDTSNGRRSRRRRFTQTLTKDHSLTTTDGNTADTSNLLNRSYMEAEGENEAAASAAEESFDGESSEMWTTFTDSFQQVQSVLDRNRVLIQQVNENHQSKIHDNLVKNVSLIQEINSNISKVVSLYSDLSVNFSNMCQQERVNTGIQSNAEAGKPDC